MDRRYKSVTFLILLLASSVVSVTEARALLIPVPGKDDIRELNGIFRTLKGSGPSPGGGGHRLKKLQNLVGGMKNSGPTPGEGHSLKTAQEFGVTMRSGPSPGQGHKQNTGSNP